MKNIVFMGTPDFATEVFKSLFEHKNFNIKAIFTQPNRAVGRKQIITPPHVKQYILDNNIDIPIYQPQKLRDEENIKILKDISPDFIVVCAYGQILSLEVLNIAPCINLHASLLPKYRGASPIQASILNNDKYTGVSAMLMNEGLDEGDILSFSVVEVGEDILVGDLFDTLAKEAGVLAVDSIEDFENIAPKKQLDLLSSHTKKIKKTDALVVFDNAKEMYLKYRAYFGWPNIYTQNKIKILKMTINEECKIHKQKYIILDIKQKYITIACNIGSVNIYTLQPDSKNKMSAVDYIKGQRKSIGDSIL